MPKVQLPSSPDYHLTVGTTGIVEPYSFYIGAELTGADIELTYRLAAWLNADISFEIYDYTSIVAAAHTGKVDLIAANLQVTPERAEALRFSDSLYQEYTGIAVTVIYFMLEEIMNTLIRWLQIRFDPKRRSKERILKGVKTDD